MIKVSIERSIGVHEGGTKYYRAYRVSITKPTKFAPARAQKWTVRNWGAAKMGSEWLDEREHGQSAIDFNGDAFNSVRKEKARRGYRFEEPPQVLEGREVVDQEGLATVLIKYFRATTVAEILKDAMLNHEGFIVTDEDVAKEATEKLMKARAKQEIAERAKMAKFEENTQWGSW